MTQSPLRAALWMMGAVGGFSSMAIAGRQLGGQLDTFEIMTYRSVIGFAVVLVLGWTTGAVAAMAVALVLGIGVGMQMEPGDLPYIMEDEDMLTMSDDGFLPEDVL